MIYSCPFDEHFAFGLGSAMSQIVIIPWLLREIFFKKFPSTLQITALIANNYLKIPKMFFSEKALQCPAHRPEPILIHAPMTDCFLD